MKPVFLSEALLPAGWAQDVRLMIEGGLTASVQQGGAPAPGGERHAIGIPGLPNLHSHAFQRGMSRSCRMPGRAPPTASGPGAR